MIRVMVMGVSGQLGWQCQQDLPKHGFELLGLGRDALDVSRGTEQDWRKAIDEHLKAFKPDWVINALAYTAVDRAEGEPNVAIQVNGSFPEVLARSLRRVSPQTYLLQCSTDYVFDGRSELPYRESDPTRPLSVYGQSKLLGEQAVLSSHERSRVLRFSWVVGVHGENFAKTILRLASERAQLRVVGDQRGVPSPTPFLVREFSRLISLYAKTHTIEDAKQQKVFHVVPSGETNWHAYAQCCIEAAAADPLWAKRLKIRWQDIACISSKAYPTKAPRPLNSLLDCAAWCDLHHIKVLPAWASVTRPVLLGILANSRWSPSL